MRYIGFDMGDGESAVAVFEQGSGIEPVILPIAGVKSLLSAVGTIGGEIAIGERAYTDALADGLSVRFKSRFTYDPASYEDIVRFARGVLKELNDAGAVQSDSRFIVGCPAGWNTACRTRYRDLLMRAGIHEPQVISESRAAFLYAKYAKTIALDIDVLNQSALVIDIGSSTLDFAYIVDGRETGVGTFGDVMLGGGFLDAEFLRRAVEKSRDREEIKQVFAECKSWYSFCEIEARRIKEEYFTRLASDPKAKVKKQLRICYDGVQKLMLELDSQEADHLIYDPLSALNGQSFAGAVESALQNAARITADKPPKLVLLTGGASRMPFFRDLCRETFGGAIVICCPDPEFSIAKGLAYAGWIDENLRAFRQAIQEEITDEKVSEIARDALPSLIPSVIHILVDLLLEEGAIPIANQWKQGEIDTLEEMNGKMESRIARVLDSPLAQEALAPAVKQWLEDVTGKLQMLVDPICDRFDVPRKDMQLDLTTDSKGNISLNTGELVGLPFLGTMLGMIVSVIVGLLCGGGGIALIATGPLGFIAGLAIGAIMSLLGWSAMSNKIMKARIPALMRNVNLEKRLRSESTRQNIRNALKGELSGEKSAFQSQVVEGFSKSFRSYLYGIAQAAEIPIE